MKNILQTAATLWVMVSLMMPSLNARSLAGIVVSPAEEPLGEIAVRLYGPREGEQGQRRELASSTTDLVGAFQFDNVPATVELIALDGPQGVGKLCITNRVNLEEGRWTIRYPVLTTVLLLHDNDLHFNFNYVARFQAEVARLRHQQEHVFLLNAGDIFIRSPGNWNIRTPEFYAEQAHAIIARMNELKYDAMTLGNHELDYVVPHTREALAQARFPLLAANVQTTTEHLPALRSSTLLTTSNDLTLSVLGVTTVNFLKDGVAMGDPQKAVLAFLAQSSNHNARIVLSHLSYPVDQVMARTAPGIDVIIGGHCHTLLEEAVTVGDTLIAQAGGTAANSAAPVQPERPKYLGVITLVFENDRLVQKSGRVLTFTAD